MAFWNKRSRSEDRALPPAENQYPLLSVPYLTSPSWPHRQLTPLQALAIGDVWAAVRVLADAASSLPLHVYRKADDGRQRVTAGRLVDLLDRPSPGCTQADLISSLVTHLAVYGNAYLGKYREAGEVSEVSLLDPLRIRPELEGGTLRWRYTPPTGPQRMLTDADVIHVKGLSVDGLVGLSAVSQAAMVIGLSDELVKHALSYFDSGEFQRPAGVLRLATGTSFEGQDRARESLRASAKPHGILLVEGEGAEYQAIAEKLDDAQFTEQRKLAAQEVARVFRIPPHMLGAPSADSMTYSNVEQESIEFVRYSLTPWLRRIELAISNDLDLTFQQQVVKFEVDGLLRADAATRSEVYAKALDPITGWMDVDEVRALEDLPPRPPRETPPAPIAVPAMNGNGQPEGRSRQDDDLADAIRALASKPSPPQTINLGGGHAKRVVRFSDGREASISEGTTTRTINFSNGDTAEVVEGEESSSDTTTNGNLEASANGHH